MDGCAWAADIPPNVPETEAAIAMERERASFFIGRFPAERSK
jgi:hypothetical protein